jgi:homoserine dehydrogenase/aspartokinase/homoserine dehydrogenase 1
VYKAAADTSGALVGEDLLPQAVRLKEEGGKLSSLGVEPLEEVLHSEPDAGTTRVVVDLAVHGDTSDLDLLGVEKGARLVLSNKGPLSGTTSRYERSSGLWGTACGTRRPSGRGCP